MWAWNSLHASLFLIFWHLIRGGHPRMTQATAHRIWHTIQNDSTQRDMILGTVQTHPSIPPALAKRIIWLLKTADRLSTYRNIAVHTPAIFSRYLKTIPSAEQQSTRTAARLRFNEIGHDQFWRFLTGDLNALSLSTRRTWLKRPEFLQLEPRRCLEDHAFDLSRRLIG
jgi:hypothetical protein